MDKGQLKITSLSTKEIIKNLFIWELKNHGFKNTKDNKLRLKKAIFDPKTFNFLSTKNKNIVLKLNNEYMCQHTIKNLFNFYVEGDEEFIGLELAKTFVASALTIPKETFIYLFERIYKDEKAKIK